MTWGEQHQLLHNLLFCTTSPYVFSVTPNRCSYQVRGACMKVLRQVISGSSLLCKPPSHPPQPGSKAPFLFLRLNVWYCKRYEAESHYDADHENCRPVDQHPKNNNNAAKNFSAALHSSQAATSGSDKWSHCGSALNLHSSYWPAGGDSAGCLYESQYKNEPASHLIYELSSLVPKTFMVSL